MLGRWLTTIALGIATTSSLAASSDAHVFGSTPDSLANRLYLELATRTEENVRYGVDGSAPFNEPLDDRERARRLLEEFLSTDPRELGLTQTEQALLLHDVWTAFDVAVRRDDALLPLLARVIDKLK